MQLLDALPVVEEGVQPRVDVLNGAEEDEDGGAVEDPEEEGGLWSRLYEEKHWLHYKPLSIPIWKVLCDLYNKNVKLLSYI